MSIPARLIRTAPAVTDEEQDRFWALATDLHPGWEHVDLRTSCLDPEAFPLTSPYWGECESGAQCADLVRFEELYHRGGVYIDSDVECFKGFDALRGLPAFAGYESTTDVCIAVLGFPPGHPLLRQTLDLAVRRRRLGTLAAGMGSFQIARKGATNVVLFPPAMFYPYLWTQDCPADLREKNPWSYCAHHWRASWKR